MPGLFRKVPPLFTASWRGWLAVLLACTLSSIPPPTLEAQTHRAHAATKAKPEPTQDEYAREKWLWHHAYSASLERAKAKGARFAEDVVFEDINDMTVMQGNANTVAVQNFFDLNGRRVTFTPSGGGYAVTVETAGMDPNIGAEIDFTASPAVNPKPEAEPGDDAYRLEDLGFTFPFYGTGHTQVAISSNGFLLFNSGAVSKEAFDQAAADASESLLDLREGLPRIAPYWHDLDARVESTIGDPGIYLDRSAERVLITYNDVPDFPNDGADNGRHTFQVALFSDGRISFSYDSVELTTRAITGITPGSPTSTPVLVDFNAPSAEPVSSPLVEVFTEDTIVDDIAVIGNFFSAHPDNYDFVYLMLDFDTEFGNNAFAFYAPIRNSVRGIGDGVVDRDPGGEILGSIRIQGYMNLANIITSYPNSPTTRFLGSNHALSIFAQEQGHAWLVFARYPGVNQSLLVGRDDAHWSFFMNAESTISRPGARRSSSAEGNVWEENSSGTFTSTGLIDGYSRFDQYLMGLRPASEVPDSFVITDPSTARFSRSSAPQAAVTVSGTRQTVTIGSLIDANGPRVPDAGSAPKTFRAAWVMLTAPGTEASPAAIAKLLRYRLAWESYFAQSTDYLGGLNTGLADSFVSRVIAVTSGADYSPVLAPGGIGTVFGSDLTDGRTEETPSANLPDTLAGVRVLVDGVPARLFLASPEQINFHVPLGTVATTPRRGVNSATALVEVYRGTDLVRAGSFQVAPASPGIFTMDRTGAGPAAAQDAFTYELAPFNARRASGEPNIISLYGTGAGPDASDAPGNFADAFRATIDGAPATLTYAGPAPGFPGLNQYNIVLPENIASGTHELVILRDGIPSNPVTLATR